MDDFLSATPKLEAFREYADPPALIAGRADRDWMEATTQRFAYRCTPLPIANASGWELVLPCSFLATWNGGPLTSDIQIKPLDDYKRSAMVVGSVFGHGVLTFHPGYLFRTSPGWALWVRGAPNTIKDGIVALDGLVETDWLPFTFTMNWRFTRPTTVRFEKGEAFCFLVMTPHALIDAIEPIVADLDDAPELKAGYEAWVASRRDFQARVARGDHDAIEQGWQRFYVQGRDATGKVEPLFHLSKRKLKAPR